MNAKSGSAPLPILHVWQHDPFLLPFYGPARLEYRGQVIPLRRKSLAVLYYLAIEGPARRRLLAGLLWERVHSLQNLRVELHSLKKTLAQFGCDLLEGGKDPLRLPARVRLDRSHGKGEPLEGLEDLSTDFQGWLEQQRAKSSPANAVRFVHGELARDLAAKVRLPHLLILSGQPDAGQNSFVRSLAGKLGLPVTATVSGGRPAVRYIDEKALEGRNLTKDLFSDRDSLWVLERSSFGEDPHVLLNLRSSFPPDRISYLDMPPLSWRELYSQLPDGLSFREAAELYTFTGGHLGFLRELLALRETMQAAHAFVLPQRIRAAYQLAARDLTNEARFALERSSIHPGSLSEGMLEALDVEAHLVELERHNWLTCDQGWRFSSNVARTAVNLSLPEGRSRLYHRIAEQALEREGNLFGAAYHRSMLGGQIDWSSIAQSAYGWTRSLASARAGDISRTPAPVTEVSLLEEYPLLESNVFGEYVEAESGLLTICRHELQPKPSGAEWQLPWGGGVIHLKGRVFVGNALGIGVSPDAVPLRLQFLGPEPRSVVLAGAAKAQLLGDGSLLLPLEAEIDCYLAFSNSLLLRLTTAAEAAVAELTVTAYRSGTSPQGHKVLAYDLEAAGETRVETETIRQYAAAG